MAKNGPNKNLASSVVALGSAAVIAVYAAGYSRTRSAAERLAQQAERRLPVGASASDPAVLPSLPTASESALSVVRPSESPVVEQRPVPPAPVEQVPEVHTSPGFAQTATDSATPLPAPAPEITSPLSDVSDSTVAASDSLQPTAPEPAPDSSVVPAPPRPHYRDGTYLGWGTSRHGDIQASVVVEGGRITSATIAQCLTRYSCSVIAALPPQVVVRQSPDVDYVSGATQSADAFYYAVAEALSKAR